MAKTVDKVQKNTTIPNEERLKQLKQLYPECLTEGEVDLEKLKDFLSTEDIYENGDERYRFTWAGKNVMLSVILNTPTEATLKPSREDSLHFDTSSKPLSLKATTLKSLNFSTNPTLVASKPFTLIHPTIPVTTLFTPITIEKPLDTISIN